MKNKKKNINSLNSTKKKNNIQREKQKIIYQTPKGQRNNPNQRHIIHTLNNEKYKNIGTHKIIILNNKKKKRNMRAPGKQTQNNKNHNCTKSLY